MVPPVRSARRAARALTSVLVLAVLAGIGCKEGFDWERDSYDRGTLGEELHKIWKKDAERAPSRSEARVEMLESNREEFVAAVDTIAPPSKLEAVDTFFQTTNEPVRTGLLPDLTRKIHLSLREAAEDDGFLRGIASDPAFAAGSFRHADAAPALVRRMLEGETARSDLLTLSTSLTESDGRRPSGAEAPGESTSFLALQWLLTESLKEVGQEGEATGLAAARDVLLREDSRFEPDRDVSLPAVRFDRRGYPMVRDRAPQSETFEPLFPFRDQNGDGLADVDDQGRFILQQQANRKIAAFDETGSDRSIGRDALDRARTGDGEIFEYIDLADTGLHFLVRQFGRLHAERATWDLLEGVPAMLGKTTQHSDQTGRYRGWEPGPVLADTTRSAGSLMTFKEVPATLRALADFLDAHEDQLAHLLHAIGEAKSKLDALPDAKLTDDSTIGYDLLPVLEETASNPALWRDVMDALREPVVARTGAAMQTLLKYRDLETLPDADGPYEACFQECKEKFEAQATRAHPRGIGLIGRFECIRSCPTGQVFEKQTKMDAPETRDNRSAHQQLFHLLRDTAGTEYEMEIERASILGIDISSLPPIIKLPGSAEAFVRSIAGNLHMKNYVSEEFTDDSTLGAILSFLGIGNGDVADLLSTLSGLFGAHLDARPTPDQITRLFNQPDLKFARNGVEIDVSDPVCKDGYIMANHHADKLFASEASGLIDAVQPLAKAFSDHGREDLFTQLFVIIHEHYSTHETLYEKKDGSPTPMKGANLVSYEPGLLKVARSGELFRALHEFAVAVDRAEPSTGKPFDERLRQLVHHAVRGDQDLRGPDGSDTLKLPDADRVSNPSRMHFLFDTLGELVDHLEQSPGQKKKLQSAVTAFSDTALETRATSGGAVFEHPGTIALLSHGARELAESAETWRDEGNLSRRLTETLPADIEEGIESRTFSTLVRFGRTISEDAEDRTAANRLFDKLLTSGPARDDLTVQSFELLVASLNSEQWAPAAEKLADWISPARRWSAPQNVSWAIDRKDLPLLSHLAELVVRIVEDDEAGTGLAMLRRGSQPLDGGETPLEVIGGAIFDYYRHDPTAGTPYSGSDYRRIFTEFSTWLGDDTHGMEQLYDILQLRSSPQ